jgi:hypothetical protein
MSKRDITNIAHSVHQRLLNKSWEEDRPFGELLQYYAMERFLYRLSRSEYRDDFILKGALLLTVWNTPVGRPTTDIDLLGTTDNSIEKMVVIVKELCAVEVERDGLVFDESTVAGEQIIQDADYEGVRVHVKGSLGNSRITLHLDIGFGDVITPKAEDIKYSSMLGFPQPVLLGYNRESTIAEKLEAMVKLGSRNSRMKDFYDIWLLSRQFDFECSLLRKAIGRTFKNRHTHIPSGIEPAVQALKNEELKQRQWTGFLKRNRLDNAPSKFGTVLDDIADFLSLPLKSLGSDTHPTAKWKAPGPWTE